MQPVLFAVVIAISSVRPAHAADPSLVIDAQGFASAQGHAVARIYQSGDDVMGEPRWTAQADIVQGHAHFSKTLPSGRYAVVVYHDLNDNGRLDHNLLGFPAEPLGFSGGFVLSLTSGLPSFEKLRFDLPAQGTTIDVHVR